MPERAVILLAEDEEDYVFLIQKAFREAEVPTALYFVPTGKDLKLYLEGQGKYANRDEYPLPDLLLVDIKLPGYSGLEVLAWMRSKPGLSGLRVVVLTSSDRLKDVNEAYRLGANSFLVKPYDLPKLVHLAKLIEEFWLKTSKCPDSYRTPTGEFIKDQNAKEEKGKSKAS